jgi:hypothetical protein
LQHPEIFPVCVACLYADADNFKKTLARSQASFIFSQESSTHNNFCFRTMKNRLHQHKGKPHIQEKFPGPAISVEDAMIKIRGLNLCGAHCT